MHSMDSHGSLGGTDGEHVVQVFSHALQRVANSNSDHSVGKGAKAA